jgi:hypothetical protein
LDALSDENKEAFEKLNVVIKDKTVKIEAANVRRKKPFEVVRRVNKRLNDKPIRQYMHTGLYKLFRIRPSNG